MKPCRGELVSRSVKRTRFGLVTEWKVASPPDSGEAWNRWGSNGCEHSSGLPGWERTDQPRNLGDPTERGRGDSTQGVTGKT